MKIGIPNGLLYCKYYPFFNTYFSELGVEIVTSSPTSKIILDDGVKYCVDDACLPVKIFHGHVLSLKDKCDIIFIPRIMQLKKNEFICPKFCGLPEMIINSIPDLPPAITEPLVAVNEKTLFKWALNTGRYFTKDIVKITKSLKKALEVQKNHRIGFDDKNYEIKIALSGHPYNIYDNYINMNVINKLNKLGIGVITSEFADKSKINNEVKNLYKKPFWTFARENYGFTVSAAKNKIVQGIIYISSFNCGIDSVIVDLIQNKIENFPFLILKLDEHTGEAGLDTRIEAFADMLERRVDIESNISTNG